jgi:hypothetical protein
MNIGIQAGMPGGRAGRLAFSLSTIAGEVVVGGRRRRRDGIDPECSRFSARPSVRTIGFSRIRSEVEFALMHRLNPLHLAVVAIACLALSGFAPIRAQTPAAAPSDDTLSIAGDVTQPLTLKPADLKTLPRTTVMINDEGRQVSYEGVLVGELLKRAGAPVGRDLSGKAVATYVRASAKDGYQVVFSLAELDPGFTPNDIIVADTVDGKPLFDYQGPFRIVAPHDKRGARSIRMLQRLDVVRLVK